MIKKLMALLVSIICFGYTTTVAFAEVDLELRCPASVKVGTALSVTVVAKNWGNTAQSLSRYMAGIVANTSNTVGGAGLYGPFPKTMAAKSVPAGKYTTSGMVPGTVAAFSIPVATAPTGTLVSGKMAMVFLDFITTTGQDIAGGSCLVSITP